MISVIICSVLFAIIAAFILDKNDMVYMSAILIIGLLGAVIGLVPASWIGTMANEQNSKTMYIEQVELSPYKNADNIYIKTYGEVYHSIDKQNPMKTIRSDITNTTINIQKDTTPVVEIKHVDPPLPIKIFGVFYEKEYYHYIIPEKSIV